MSCRRGQTATYWPQVLLTIAALLSHSGWAAQPWFTESSSPLSGAGSHSAGILSPTDSSRVLVIFLFDIHLLPLIYTSASLDWQLGRGSICNRMVSEIIRRKITYEDIFGNYWMNYLTELDQFIDIVLIMYVLVSLFNGISNFVGYLMPK